MKVFLPRQAAFVLGSALLGAIVLIRPAQPEDRLATETGVSVGAREAIIRNNIAVVMRSEKELWSAGRLHVAPELYAPNFVCHFPIGPEWRGIEGITSVVRNHRRSFPDWNEHVEDVIAAGDKVVIRFTSTGTQLGTFQGIPATGRNVKISEVAIFRLANSKIVEQWGMPDLAGLMSQLKTR